MIDPRFSPPDIGRLIAAMRGEPTDRVPNFEVLIEDQHVERLLGAGREHARGRRRSGQGQRSGRGRQAHVPRRLPRTLPHHRPGRDRAGNLWTPIRQRCRTARRPSGATAASRTAPTWSAIVWPGESDIEERLSYVREYVAAARGTGIGVMFLCGCIWQTLYEFVIGLNDCMVMMIDEPDLFEELMARSADYFAELVRRVIAEGVDIIFLADDFAFNKGLFVRPSIMERLWLPHFDRIVAPAREAGLPILFHSDGRIDDAVEMLLGMGIDCLNPMDPSGIDYRDYKRRYGHRVTLSGNIDITWPLVKGTPEDVERDVGEHMDVLKPGGRWIAGSSHSIVNYIPHENFVAMINAIHRYGKY